MKKYLLKIFIALTIFSCQQKTKVTTTTFTDTGIKDSIIPTLAVKIDTVKTPVQLNDTILPGVSVGNIKLGEKAEMLIQKKGTPDSSDAAINKTYNEWLTKPTMMDADTVATSFKTFSVVSAKKEAAVKRIRITSPMYKTALQVKTGNTLAYIKLQYSSLKKPVATAETIKGDEIEIYDETDEGIAFEIINNKCIAIIIHEKGQKYNSPIF